MAETLEIKIKIDNKEAQRNLAATKKEFEKLRGEFEKAKLDKFNKGLTSISQGFKKVGDEAVKWSTAVLGVAGAGIKAFSDFEDQLASVKKSTGATDTELKVIGDSFLELSKNTRTSIAELNQIATVGGQIGIGAKDIVGFTEAIDKLNVALGDEFEGGAEQITAEIGTLRQLFKDIKTDNVSEDLLRIGNAINELGTSGLATGSVVADFATRISGLTSHLGVGAGDILGLSAALQELGVNAERGGSNVGRVINLIATKSDKIADTLGLNAKEFSKLVNRDINEAFLTVADRVAELGTTNEKAAQLMKDLGFRGVGMSEVLVKVGQNVDFVRGRQELGISTLKEMGSVTTEFNTKNETTAANIAKMRNQIQTLAIKIGETLVPMVRDLLKWLEPVIQNIVKWVKENPELIKNIVKIAAVIGGLAAAGAVIGSIVTGLSGIAMIIGGLSGALAAVGASLGVIAGPVGIAAVGIVASLKLISDAEDRLRQATERRQEVQRKAAEKAATITGQVNLLKGKDAGEIARLMGQLQSGGTEKGQKAAGLLSKAAGGEQLTADELKVVNNQLNKLIESNREQTQKLGQKLNQIFQKSAEGVRIDEKVRNAISRLANTQAGAAINNAVVQPVKNMFQRAFPFLKFAEGGVVPGGSLGGDRMPAMVNSGEMVLTKQMQMKLLQMLSKPSVNLNGNFNFGGQGQGGRQQMNSFIDMLAMAAR